MGDPTCRPVALTRRRRNGTLKQARTQDRFGQLHPRQPFGECERRLRMQFVSPILTEVESGFEHDAHQGIGIAALSLRRKQRLEVNAYIAILGAIETIDGVDVAEMRDDACPPGERADATPRRARRPRRG